MRDRDPYVLVCVPNMGTWCDETAKSMTLMFSYYALNQVPGARSQRMGLISVQGSMLPQQRHLCIQKACQEKTATHVMFIDADMVFPKPTVNKLLQHDRDIVALNCTTRKEPILPVAFGFDDQRISSVGRHGLEKVRQVGLAVSLLRIDMLRKMRPPFFLQEWVPDLKAYCGEDVYFCQAAQAAGYDVWVDHDLSREIHHVGAREWGYEDVIPENVEIASNPIRVVKQGAMS